MPANSSPVTESCSKISCDSQIETDKEASPHLQLQQGIAYLCRQMVELPLCLYGVGVVVLSQAQESNEAEAPTTLAISEIPAPAFWSRRISVCKQSDAIIVNAAGAPTR